MREYDAIVIGAGNGGMLAACALAKDGVKTLLIEKHNIPGGAATSFRRGRFEFETALHQLSCLGTPDKPGALRTIFDELGITDKIEWLEMANIVNVIVPGKFSLALPADRAKIEMTLKAVFPDSAAGIEKYFEVVYGVWEEYKKLFNYDYDSDDPFARIDPDASPEKYPYFYKYAYMPMPQFFAENDIKNPMLIGALSTMTAYAGPMPECTMIDVAQWTYCYIEYKPYHVRGCSFSISSALTERFRELGGTLMYNSKVTRILVEDGKAVGVRLESGEEIRAKEIIANLSPMLAYKKMMDAKDVPQGAIEPFKNYRMQSGTFQVYLGLDCEPWDIGINDTNNFILTPDGGRVIATCHDVADPETHGRGKCELTLLFLDTGDNWMDVPPEEYFAKKYERADQMVSICEAAYPGLRSHIEEMEISSAVTNARFLGSQGGSIGGFRTFSRDYFLAPMHNNEVLPGLSFVGQFDNNTGGFHPTMLNGWSTGHTIAAKLN